MIQLASVPASAAMVGELVQLHADTTVHEAVETFEEYRISGAPVVNEAGAVVGVLTTSDIVRSGRLHEAEGGGQLEYADPESRRDAFAADEGGGFNREDYNLDVLKREMVGDWMTPDVTTVEGSASLLDVCSIMARDRIHRVFVIEDRKLVGVISTFDVVGYLSANP